MKRFDAGISGHSMTREPPKIADISLGTEWVEALQSITSSQTLRTVQAKALDEIGILRSRKNLVVSAPTNSGKTLVGYVLLLDAVRRGYRAILLEPLRALAQEKTDELKSLVTRLPRAFMPKPPAVAISTGDYRLEHVRFQDAPLSHGEIVVATPERLEAILRSPGSNDWLSHIGVVVIDEAHTIASPHRGAVLEYLIAILRSVTAPPRMALLSATMGEPERLADWLSPCDLLVDRERTPQLSKEICLVESGEDPNELVAGIVSDVLADNNASVLIFVYRRADCRSLVDFINKRMCTNGDESALPYHSGMSASERETVRKRYLEGASRCVVTTTALAMGVNLPATHVIIRDTTFWGHGRVPVHELLQMLGRAGRGDRTGHGLVLLKPRDEWEPAQLAPLLMAEEVPPLRSSFEIPAGAPRLEKMRDHPGSDIPRAAEIIAALTLRHGNEGLLLKQMTSMLGHMLAGERLKALVPEGLSWLTGRFLLYQDESSKYHLTKLGEKATESVFPARHAAGVGQLLRDLLEVDSEDRVLTRWSPLDHLILLELISDRSPELCRFSEGLVDQVDGWMEGRPAGEKSILYAEWLRGQRGYSKADELLGSLGQSPSEPGKSATEMARKTGVMAVFRALVLYELSRGNAAYNIERTWRIKNLEGLQETWRDTILWLLSGLLKIYDVKCFYFHLRENCDAETERIHRVKGCLARMRGQAYDLMEAIKYCSPLGPLMRGVRGMLKTSKDPKIGLGSIKKLEEAGIRSMADVAKLEIQELSDLGLRKSFARQVRQYLRRRMI